MRRLALVLAVLLASCGGSTGGTTSPDQGSAAPTGPVDAATWASLEAKPLQLAPLKSGESCPLSSSAMLTGSATGLAFGDGPIYAVPGGPIIVLPAAGPDGTHPAKILWIASPDYRGGALIRGARLDAEAGVTFDDGKKSLRFDTDTGTSMGDATQGSSQGWRYLPTTANLPATGCYGFQIDLPSKTITVILRAA